MADNTSRSHMRLILRVACSIALGLIAGIPLIYRKNGMGLLVVFLVSVLAAFTISAVAKRDLPARRDESEDPTFRPRGRPIWSVALFAGVGSTIAVIGGIVTHYVSPMHPLDVLPNLTALAILGAFAGFVVGMTLLFAMIFSHR